LSSQASSEEESNLFVKLHAYWLLPLSGFSEKATNIIPQRIKFLLIVVLSKKQHALIHEGASFDVSGIQSI
jgi:hypothetical protein